VRRYAFYWRYDTKETLLLLNELWPFVNDRLIAARILTPERKAALIAYRDSVSPATVAKETDRIQQQLTQHAAELTRSLEAAELAKQLNTQTGIRPAKRHASKAKGCPQFRGHIYVSRSVNSRC